MSPLSDKQTSPCTLDTASWEWGRAPEDDQGLSCVRAGSFWELISLWVAHSSQITQDDGGIQMALFIMITMMVLPQQKLRTNEPGTDPSQRGPR